MKTFTISYIISLSALIYIWLPDVVARPFHILPRLAFYLAFPLAIFVSFGLLLLVTQFELLRIKTDTDGLSGHQPAESPVVGKAIKSA